MGFAILWVVFLHSPGNYSRFPILYYIKNIGNLGVDIFLLLSGIGLYYSAKKLRKEYGNQWILPFYKKRFMRIMPTTIICLLPWFCYLYRGTSVNPLRFLLDITSFSYWFNGTNRGWYVALSVVLYLLYPLLYTLIDKTTPKKRILYCALLVTADIVMNTGIAIFFPQWFQMVNLALCRVPVFIIGCFLALKVEGKKEFDWLPLICLIVGIVVAAMKEKYEVVTMQYGIWRYLWGIIGFCITVVLASLFQSVLGQKIVKFFRFFGKYTLEMYLIHTTIWTIAMQTFSSGVSIILLNVVCFFLTLIASIIVHEGMDLLFRKLSKN